MQEKLVPPTGLVSELSPMNQLDLIATDDLIIGGHDIVERSLPEQAEIICERSKTYSFRLLQQIKFRLETIDQSICTIPELSWDVTDPPVNSPSLAQLCKKFRQILTEFADAHQLDHVIVVNLASAEAQTPVSESHDRLALFEELIAKDRKDSVSPSMFYAYAAFLEGYSFVNFTPNPGPAISALSTLAAQKQSAYCGNDGKTGETLLKTVLAPMFAARNLKILSWEGVNLLGNDDGKTLNEPDKCKNKLANKSVVLPQILGYPVHSNVSINYVPSLGDWKTAWDLIHFQGFLDVPMTMQFTWQGCDSILAAPLVLDLIRFTEFAHRNGESGTLVHLACFFKNPLNCDQHHFFKQFELLIDYTRQHL